MAVIRKTESEKWELDIRLNGKRKRLTFGTRREAEDAKRELAFGRSVVVGQAGQVTKTLKPITLKDAIRFYYETESQRKASKYQEKLYFDRLYMAMKAEGVAMVHDVTTKMLDGFKAERLKAVSANTVNREFNSYRHFFAKCVAWDHIAENPYDRIENAPGNKNPRRVWTDDEFRAMLAAAPAYMADVFTAMYWFGVGTMEIARLTWADVNWQRSTVLFRRFKGDGRELRRHIFMPPACLLFMRSKLESARRMFRAGPDDLVFTNSQGRRIQSQAFAKTAREVRERAGIPEGVVAYGLRHKFATELLEANVGEDLVRKLTGHQDVRTLIDNYSHIRQPALEQAMGVRAEQASKVFTNETSN